MSFASKVPVANAAAVHRHTPHCTRTAPLLQAGLDEAAEQLRRASSVIDSDPATTENRIVVLTGDRPVLVWTRGAACLLWQERPERRYSQAAL